MNPIKDRLRSKWVDFHYGQLQDHRSNVAGDKFQLTPPSREDAVQWIAAAWSGISQETIVAGFRKCVFAPSEVLSIHADGKETDQENINDLVDGFKDLHVVNRHIKDVSAEDDVLEK
uniref:AlNc14C58G4338 protein n=1 Tax=Albugo laibachii Nc14 TaxID=890382 RepID=F0WCF8_9STRA|nr:AlNc14C58G4338 [Albugo laibachii Nc14]|eukprot:CCA18873.1 AlNc14C58G4338 [Albugo laibachii Nc14]